MLHAAPSLDRGVLDLALAAVAWADGRGLADRDDRLTVIDYSRPSTERRLWVFDLETGALIFHELVAHGRGSGEDQATRFSNRDGSHQTSLGLFRTGETYNGGNGYSLRLHGLEPGINDLALARTIVIHGAPYVSAEFARRQGRLGRSWGCPALELRRARPVIDEIRDGSLLFAYYPQREWLTAASYRTTEAVRAPGGVISARAAAK
jgi:hypothetical protein